MTAMALRFHSFWRKWRMSATHESVPYGGPTSVVHFSVLGGMAVAEIVLVALVLFSSPVKSGAARHAPVACQPYVELRSVAANAKDLGKPEDWVSENYRVNLWSSLTNDRWRIGELAPGGRAVILDRNEYGYRVRTGDGVEGWVSNFHVSRTLKQDADTQRPCE
jgi:hypothetical protein